MQTACILFNHPSTHIDCFILSHSSIPIFFAQDKSYSRQNNKMLVYNLGLHLFEIHVVRNASVNNRLRAVLLENVFRERTGERIDRVLMKNCLAMLIEVAVKNEPKEEVYQQEFENEFLRQSHNFYKQESQEFISNNTVPDYLRKVNCVAFLLACLVVLLNSSRWHGSPFPCSSSISVLCILLIALITTSIGWRAFTRGRKSSWHIFR